MSGRAAAFVVGRRTHRYRCGFMPAPLPTPPTNFRPYADDTDAHHAHERRTTRPTFERLVAQLSRSGKGEAIVVADLTRLFRSGVDRRRIDRLLAEGRAQVASVKEDIKTWTPEGRRRYDAMADLICLSYEGAGRPGLPYGPPPTRGAP